MAVAFAIRTMWRRLFGDRRRRRAQRNKSPSRRTLHVEQLEDRVLLAHAAGHEALTSSVGAGQVTAFAVDPSYVYWSEKAFFSRPSRIRRMPIGGGDVTDIASHEIGDGVIIGAQAGIPTGKKVPDRSILIGSPARPAREMKKQVAAQLRAAEMWEIIKNLKKRIEELERERATSLPAQSS